MPEHIRALVAILALALPVFAIAKIPACAVAIEKGAFERRRNLWFALTLTVFLANNFWVYILIAAILLLAWMPREANKLAMFFFLLFAVPAVPKQIGGLGIVEHLFAIDYVRLLCLIVLLPAFLTLRREADAIPFGRLLPDKLLAAYLVLVFLLQLRGDTLTNAMRHEVLYAFTDIFLPYYVASRSLKKIGAFRDVMMSYAVGAMVLAAIGFVEFMRHWLLYTSLDRTLDSTWYSMVYLMRGSNLRAVGSTQQPIVLGYVMAVAIGYFLYLRRSVPSPVIWGLGMAVLCAGLVAPISRGPWVGATAMVLIFVAAGPNAFGRLAVFSIACLLLLPLLLVSPFGQRIIDLMPFLGTVDASTVTYRERVLKNSLQLIARSPFFGDVNFVASPLMQELRQGQGIIDIVNSYMIIGLESGLVGLSLFCGFFASVGFAIVKGLRAAGDKHDERHALGRALLATLLCILLVIFTASSISLIPVIYWTTAGLGVAYARMLAPDEAPSTAVATRQRGRNRYPGIG
jgi:O-Antigen ligase